MTREEIKEAFNDNWFEFYVNDIENSWNFENECFSAGIINDNKFFIVSRDYINMLSTPINDIQDIITNVEMKKVDIFIHSKNENMSIQVSLGR